MRLDANLRLSDSQVDAMAGEFDQMRKGSEGLLRSAISPQEVQPRPAIANDGQRSRERVSAGQALFSGASRR